jgi:hypothetical protein
MAGEGAMAEGIMAAESITQLLEIDTQPPEESITQLSEESITQLPEIDTQLEENVASLANDNEHRPLLPDCQLSILPSPKPRTQSSRAHVMWC